LARVRQTADVIIDDYFKLPKNEYIQFLHIALGSLRELDTQLIIAQEVGLAETRLFQPVMNEVEEMQRIMVSSAEFAEKIALFLLPSSFFLLPSSSLCPLPSSSCLSFHQKIL
jgi:hypothetical protein